MFGYSESISAVDHLVEYLQLKLDAKAMKRLLLLEARHNVSVIDPALKHAEKLPHASDAARSEFLWRVPPLLKCEIIALVLGSGRTAAQVYKKLQSVNTAQATDPLVTEGNGGILPRVYVRLVALQSLARLRGSDSLDHIDIRRRLENLKTNFHEIRVCLESESRE